jgi:TRAP-type uncharacterized transport system fused permease subunit
MAAIPAFLYYLSVVLMIEAESRRLGTRAVSVETGSLGALTRRGGYHFISPVAIAGLMLFGLTAFRAVFWAGAIVVALSFLDRKNALWPGRLFRALETGGRGVLSIAATTATAGVIVGVMTLTGLGLKIAGIIVSLAGGSVLLTVVYAAFAVWLLGLAVPVTASYIIAAVMIAPALTQVGVADVAAHMFIFYYAVLSEVSPPTALSPFAAAALTGGNPFRTTMATWKYTAPAFLVPFAFTISPEGLGILMRGTSGQIVWTAATASVGVGALAAGLGGWIGTAATWPERGAMIAAALLLFHAGAVTDAAGFVLLLAVLALHFARVRRAA